MKRRLLALILSVMMILSLAPASVFAEESEEPTEGEPVVVTPEEPAEEPAAEPAEEPIEEPAEEPAAPVAEPAEEPTRNIGRTRSSEETIAVFYTDSLWWGDVHVYYWDDGGEWPEWPGVAMTKLYSNGYGQSVYGALVPEDVGIIFNGQGKQTDDITTGIADGAWWYAKENTDNVGHYQFGQVNDTTHHAAAPATCTAPGNIEYYELDNNYYNDALESIAQADTEIPATGHSWDLDNPVWGDLESDGYFGYQTTITFTCTTCHDTTSVVAPGGLVTEMDPNCAEPSYESTVCTATFGGREFSKEYRWNEGPIDPTAHPFDLAHTAAKPATCTEPGNSEYWYCGTCDKYFSDEDGENEIEANSWVIPATGHSWGAPTYVWAEDYSTCTATRVCGNDASHTETETANSTSVGPDDNGVTTYTATFANEAFAAQTKQIQTIGPIGGEPIEMGYLYFMKNDGSEEKISQEMSVLEMLAPECPWTREGFSFTGWNTKADGTGDTLQPGDDVEDVLDAWSSDESYFFYAQWEVAAAPVAKIGDTTYPSLQAAVDAAHEMTGDVTVTLVADTEEAAWVHQKAGLNLTIDGDNHKISGQILIDGDNRLNDSETLKIEDITFEVSSVMLTTNFIHVPSLKKTGTPYYTNKYNYAHNITISNCTFTGVSDAEYVAFAVENKGGAKNITLSELTASYVHSLAQFNSVEGDITVEDCNATNALNGISITNPHNNITITGNTISCTGTKSDSYVYRIKGTDSGANVTLSDNTFVQNNDNSKVFIIQQNATAIESGYYAGDFLVSNGITFVITGGYFTAIPDPVFCGQDAQGQLYPIANPDENTNAEYPYTVGHPVALVNDLGYMTFAAAAAARTSNDDVITLLADIEDAYTLAAGETLKVKLDGHALTVEAPEGYLLVTEGPVDGVTTYSLKQIPPLPEAKITVVEDEDAHTHIEEWAYSAENGYGTTGEYVETLGAEYEFVLDPETTQEQKDYYKYWGCDFLVSFDADMDANSFGLFGAYGDYKVAFKFPEDIAANNEFKLVSWLGQKILGNAGFDTRFSDIMDIDFFCGVYNLSAKNCGKTMTVKLVMWDPENPNDIKVIDTKTYTFPTPEMPGAEVTDVTGTHSNVSEYVFTEGGYEVTGTVEALDAEYLFKLKSDEDERIAKIQNEYYADWRVDYVVSFDDNMTANSFGLFGAYGDYNVAFKFPEDIAANNEFKLCEWIAQKTGLEHDFKIKFSDIINYVEGSFYCGVYNLDYRNAGKTMTVTLVMWNESDPETLYPITTTTYTFKEFVPPLPEAEVEDAATPETVDVNGESIELEAEYVYTAIEPTEQQLAYYGPWRADFRVTFSDAMEAESFGLYGAYGTNKLGFKYPSAVSAGETVYLMSTIDETFTYNDVWTYVKAFTCGVFNLDYRNAGKSITVDLVIWNANDTAEPTVIATKTYTFKELVPPLPEANVKSIETETVAINGENVKLEAEYKFTPVEPTEQQLAYYGNWYADYRVSMDANTAAESFGLYGAYDGYGQHFAQGFLFPQAMTAKESVMLLELANLSGVTYNDVAVKIGEFICGVFNKSADNVGKTFTVELVIWDPADPDTKYVIATTQYKFAGMYTVTLTSQDNNGNTGVATLEGGGEYISGTEVTVKANVPSGFTFDGWYENGELVAADASYTFMVEADRNLVAKYTSTGMGKLHVYGDNYIVNDGTSDVAPVLQESGRSDFNVTVGARAFVQYNGEDFLYWVNISNNVVSTTAKYEFTMVGETTLKLITTTDAETDPSVYVYIMNAYKQVQGQGRAVDVGGLLALFPQSNPTLLGGTFAGWTAKEVNGAWTEEMTGTLNEFAAAIIGHADTTNVIVEITPKYTFSSDDVYTLNVYYKSGDAEPVIVTDLSGSFPANATKTIKVSDILELVEGVEEADFSYWMFNGVIDSYDTQCSFKYPAGSTVELVAVFDGAAEPEAKLSIAKMFGTKDGDNYKISTMLRWFVPSDYTVHKIGFVFTTNAAYGTDEALVLDSGIDAVKTNNSGLTGKSGFFTLNLNAKTNADRVVYIRAFIQYEDGEGIQTMYTPVQSGSYNSLTTQP